MVTRLRAILYNFLTGMHDEPLQHVSSKNDQIVDYAFSLNNISDRYVCWGYFQTGRVGGCQYVCWGYFQTGRVCGRQYVCWGYFQAGRVGGRQYVCWGY